MNILIGGAWPYANGSLHLGHLAALLPGDILARYHRQKGDSVLYVSGSDCHGTPIFLRAKAEGTEPHRIAERYHAEFKRCFDTLGFSYDLYALTDDSFHKETVRAFIKRIYENGYIAEKEVEQLYCEKCALFLADRYVEGLCPHCGHAARGDQCDDCGALLSPLELTDRACKTCGEKPIIKKDKQLFFKLSAFQRQLEGYLKQSKLWRPNAAGATERYLREGLIDRAVSRDLPWGIALPVKGYENEKPIDSYIMVYCKI